MGVNVRNIITVIILIFLLLCPIWSEASIVWSDDYESYPTGPILQTDVYNQLIANGYSAGEVVCQDNQLTPGTPSPPCTTSMVSSPTHAGNRAMRMEYNLNAIGDRFDSKITRLLNIDEFYERFYMRFDTIDNTQPSFFCCNQPGDSQAKLHYFNPSVGWGIIDFFYNNLVGATSPSYYVFYNAGGLHPPTGVSFLENPPGSGTTDSYNLPPNLVTNYTFPHGTWVCYQTHVKLNTPGLRDGVLEVWITDPGFNGGVRTQTLRYTDVEARKLSSEHVTRFQFYRQGALYNNYRYEDDYVMATTQAEATCAGGVNNQAPNGTIMAPAANANITIGGTVNFIGSGTDPDNNTPLTYLWNFGSGSGIANSTSQNPGIITFNNAGTFTVTFTVIDSLGLSDQTPDSRIITVTGSSPSAGVISVTSVLSTSITLTLGSVSDGQGGIAKYDVRYAISPISWGSATSEASCVNLFGPGTCTISGLAPGTTYDIQGITYRGTLNVDAVFGPFTSVITRTTAAGTPPAPPTGVTVQ